MKVVLDTNIFISGIFWEGDSNKVILAWKDKKFTLVNSQEIIFELIKVLKDFKIRLPEEIINEWIKLISNNSEIVMIENDLNIIVEDLSDNKFIETALVGKADYIITQDNHLLKLKEFEGIRILTPKEFLNIIKNGMQKL